MKERWCILKIYIYDNLKMYFYRYSLKNIRWLLNKPLTKLYFYVFSSLFFNNNIYLFKFSRPIHFVSRENLMCDLFLYLLIFFFFHPISSCAVILFVVTCSPESKLFQEGRDDTNNGPRSVRPSTSTTDLNANVTIGGLSIFISHLSP